MDHHEIMEFYSSTLFSVVLKVKSSESNTSNKPPMHLRTPNEKSLLNHRLKRLESGDLSEGKDSYSLIITQNSVKRLNIDSRMKDSTHSSSVKYNNSPWINAVFDSPVSLKIRLDFLTARRMIYTRVFFKKWKQNHLKKPKSNLKKSAKKPRKQNSNDISINSELAIIREEKIKQSKLKTINPKDASDKQTQTCFVSDSDSYTHVAKGSSNRKVQISSDDDAEYEEIITRIRKNRNKSAVSSIKKSNKTSTLKQISNNDVPIFETPKQASIQSNTMISEDSIKSDLNENSLKKIQGNMISKMKANRTINYDDLMVDSSEEESDEIKLSELKSKEKIKPPSPKPSPPKKTRKSKSPKIDWVKTSERMNKTQTVEEKLAKRKLLHMMTAEEEPEVEETPEEPKSPELIWKHNPPQEFQRKPQENINEHDSDDSKMPIPSPKLSGMEFYRVPTEERIEIEPVEPKLEFQSFIISDNVNESKPSLSMSTALPTERFSSDEKSASSKKNMSRDYLENDADDLAFRNHANSVITRLENQYSPKKETNYSMFNQKEREYKPLMQMNKGNKKIEMPKENYSDVPDIEEELSKLSMKYKANEYSPSNNSNNNRSVSENSQSRKVPIKREDPRSFDNDAYYYKPSSMPENARYNDNDAFRTPTQQANLRAFDNGTYTYKSPTKSEDASNGAFSYKSPMKRENSRNSDSNENNNKSSTKPEMSRFNDGVAYNSKSLTKPEGARYSYNSPMKDSSTNTFSPMQNNKSYVSAAVQSEEFSPFNDQMLHADKTRAHHSIKQKSKSEKAIEKPPPIDTNKLENDENQSYQYPESSRSIKNPNINSQQDSPNQYFATQFKYPSSSEYSMSPPNSTQSYSTNKQSPSKMNSPSSFNAISSPPDSISSINRQRSNEKEQKSPNYSNKNDADENWPNNTSLNSMSKHSPSKAYSPSSFNAISSPPDGISSHNRQKYNAKLQKSPDYSNKNDSDENWHPNSRYAMSEARSHSLEVFDLNHADSPLKNGYSPSHLKSHASPKKITSSQITQSSPDIKLKTKRRRRKKFVEEEEDSDDQMLMDAYNNLSGRLSNIKMGIQRRDEPIDYTAISAAIRAQSKSKPNSPVRQRDETFEENSVADSPLTGFSAPKADENQRYSSTKSPSYTLKAKNLKSKVKSPKKAKSQEVKEASTQHSFNDDLNKDNSPTDEKYQISKDLSRSSAQNISSDDEIRQNENDSFNNLKSSKLSDDLKSSKFDQKVPELNYKQRESNNEPKSSKQRDSTADRQNDLLYNNKSAKPKDPMNGFKSPSQNYSVDAHNDDLLYDEKAPKTKDPLNDFKTSKQKESNNDLKSPKKQKDSTASRQNDLVNNNKSAKPKNLLNDSKSPKQTYDARKNDLLGDETTPKTKDPLNDSRTSKQMVSNNDLKTKQKDSNADRQINLLNNNKSPKTKNSLGYSNARQNGLIDSDEEENLSNNKDSLNQQSPIMSDVKKSPDSRNKNFLQNEKSLVYTKMQQNSDYSDENAEIFDNTLLSGSELPNTKKANKDELTQKSESKLSVPNIGGKSNLSDNENSGDGGFVFVGSDEDDKERVRRNSKVHQRRYSTETEEGQKLILNQAKHRLSDYLEINEEKPAIQSPLSPNKEFIEIKTNENILDANKAPEKPKRDVKFAPAETLNKVMDNFPSSESGFSVYDPTPKRNPKNEFSDMSDMSEFEPTPSMPDQVVRFSKEDLISRNAEEGIDEKGKIPKETPPSKGTPANSYKMGYYEEEEKFVFKKSSRRTPKTKRRSSQYKEDFTPTAKGSITPQKNSKIIDEEKTLKKLTLSPATAQEISVDVQKLEISPPKIDVLQKLEISPAKANEWERKPDLYISSANEIAYDMKDDNSSNVTKDDVENNSKYRKKKDYDEKFIISQEISPKLAFSVTEENEKMPQERSNFMSDLSEDDAPENEVQGTPKPLYYELSHSIYNHSDEDVEMVGLMFDVGDEDGSSSDDLLISQFK